MGFSEYCRGRPVAARKENHVLSTRNLSTFGELHIIEGGLSANHQPARAPRARGRNR